jgi:hypothetical protein
MNLSPIPPYPQKAGPCRCRLSSQPVSSDRPGPVPHVTGGCRHVA